MRLRTLSLRDFRNVGFATLEFSGRRQFLAGRNGQGKSNLLEAAGFLTALRSFRTTDGRLLVSHDRESAMLAYLVEHERMGETRVGITLRRDGKELWCDEERVTRLADHLGRFPTVVFSSLDMQLLRGAPAGRRRWLDLTLAAVDAGYLRTLQVATRALAERNALLKSGRGTDAELDAFETMLAPAAAELMERRTDGLAALGRGLASAYARLSGDREPVELAYVPHGGMADAAEMRRRLAEGRAKDRRWRTTMVGPHRDDVFFKVKGVAAKDYGSEGQQRSLVLALRLAQAAWFQDKSGIRPVLLADDVLGELDPERRGRFWSAIEPETQLIATGTTVPEADAAWQVFEVDGGAFKERPAA